MTFRVEFTDRADAEVQDTIFWLIGNAPEYARRWQEGLDQAAGSLADFPDAAEKLLITRASVSKSANFGTGSTG